MAKICRDKCHRILHLWWRRHHKRIDLLLWLLFFLLFLVLKVLPLACCRSYRILTQFHLVLLLLNHPIKDIVVFVAHSVEQILEQLPQVGIVRPIFKVLVLALYHILDELFRKSLTEVLQTCLLLFFLDLLIFFFFGLGLEALPGQPTSQKVDEDISQALQIISSALFNTDVGVDRGVPSGPCQILPILVWDVLSGLGITVSLG